jgi:hypothetical protein
MLSHSVETPLVILPNLRLIYQIWSLSRHGVFVYWLSKGVGFGDLFNFILFQVTHQSRCVHGKHHTLQFTVNTKKVTENTNVSSKNTYRVIVYTFEYSMPNFYGNLWRIEEGMIYFIHCVLFSCEIVALRENFIDRPESYNSYSAKSCIFLAHEKTCMVWGIFLYSHTQSDPKVSKKFLRHFPTALVPSLTLRISDIIQSSFESHTLEFFAYHLPYSRSRCLVTWQREFKLCNVSDGTRVVGKGLRTFWYLALGHVV